ncbi:MAG: hypothetical protein GY814_12915, partial [Gammaproteobacteria bacterium]|nr:hypothetical protein [Gammaproteobacteria bacterium]
RLDGQGDDAYKAYIARGLFLPVINPTATAFTGAIMRNEPVTEIPTNIDYLLTDTNNSKRPLSLVASMVLRELMTSGRCGGLVEHDGTRTKVLLYPFESIINWTDEFIVLSQEYNEEGKDEYDIVTKTEYLKLMLVEGVYTQEIWREDKKSWSVVKTIVPTNRGEAIGYIPF